MGLAASQARMLLLTSQKSDLEQRAQQISRRRLILSQSLEQYSQAYEASTSNRQMKISVYNKAADGKTDLEAVIAHNNNLRDTGNLEGNAIWYHLVQDTHTDELFQGYMADCYVDAGNDCQAENVNLYGNDTKGGFARFKQTGEVVSMDDFRRAVTVTQKLTTLELFTRLRNAYPTITFVQI